jgi:hypothetical protein
MSLVSFCFSFLSIMSYSPSCTFFDILDSHLVDWFSSGDIMSHHIMSLVWLYLFHITFRVSHEDPPKNLLMYSDGKF